MINNGKPINIVFLTTWLMRGGAQVQLLNFIPTLPDYVKCTVVTVKDEGPLANDFRMAGIPVIALDFKHKISIWRFWRLVRLLKANKTDVMFTIGYGDSMFWGRLAALLTQTRLIYSSLNSLPDTGGRFVPVNQILNRYNTRFFPVASTPVMMDYLTKEHNIPLRKITPMGSGVDQQALARIDGQVGDPQLAAKLEAQAGKVLIVQAASLNYFKNQLQTIRVAQQLRDSLKIDNFHIFLAGEGPDRLQLEQAIEEREIHSHVTMLGYLSHQTCLNLIFKANIVILPSLSEGFPNILLESAILKKPVIACDVGGVRDIVRHGESGYLMEPDDDPGFTNFLEELIRDENKRSRLGLAGYKHVSTHYTLEKKLEKFLTVLENDLSQVANSAKRKTS